MGDFTTDNLTYKVTERYSFGWVNWKDGIALNSMAHPTPAEFNLWHSEWRREYDQEFKRAHAYASGDYAVWREEDKWT